MTWQAHTGFDYTVVMRDMETTDTASIRLFCDDAPELAATIAAWLNDQPEPARYDYAISDDGKMTVAEGWQRDNLATSLRLLAVSIEVDEATVDTWRDEAVQQADIWAWTSTLSASDHDDIQVPAKPAFLPDYTPFSAIAPDRTDSR